MIFIHSFSIWRNFSPSFLFCLFFFCSILFDSFLRVPSKPCKSADISARSSPIFIRGTRKVSDAHRNSLCRLKSSDFYDESSELFDILVTICGGWVRMVRGAMRVSLLLRLCTTNSFELTDNDMKWSRLRWHIHSIPFSSHITCHR